MSMLASQGTIPFGAVGGARAVDRTELMTVTVVVGVFPLSCPGPPLPPMLTVVVLVILGVDRLVVLLVVEVLVVLVVDG